MSIEDHETALFTALSVALEELSAIINATLGGVQLGFMQSALTNAREELDKFLVDRDHFHIAQAKSFLDAANRQMEEWA